MKYIHLFIIMTWLGFASSAQTTIAEKTKSMSLEEGFFSFYRDNNKGKIWLVVDKLDTEFLYVNSLPAGVGSNDIGLDRGQLGGTQIVEFRRVGPKLLLVQPNYNYRAISDNPEEAKSVKEAFAESVLWGFPIEAETSGRLLIDLTPFLLRDAHGVVSRLKRGKEGGYKVDKTRSAIYPPMIKNFPMNSEFEATITFTGEATGRYLRTVTPNGSAVTVRMHHSFVQLPDDKYTPRVFDPRAGYGSITYLDYATPIDQPIRKRFIRRHRLNKKNPSAKVSEAVEPIIYYVDRGAPEPIKSALIEGASWWNEAFEAAGYKDAFIVKELPPEADPMDVRYNLIQWVHRSTRGWSYGASVADPRTGEIIKGHVSLGSLRVRQDFLIAQGLLTPYETGTQADPRLLKMALMRLRQLSAHEVGHTIGFSHNYISSRDGRTSVMDYPHPKIGLKNGQIDLSEAYDVGIGNWDKVAVTWGYQDFPKGTDEQKVLSQMLDNQIQNNLHYITDADSRARGGAHPTSHLWDNGASATEELKHLMSVRKHVLNNFSEKQIPVGMPMSTLEEVLVPMYMLHRYQFEATVKVIGGSNYSYKVRGDVQALPQNVSAKEQNEAIQAIAEVLSPENLALPQHILNIIPPRVPGYGRSRETFKVRTGVMFDPVSPGESIVGAVLSLLFNAERATRLTQQKQIDPKLPGLSDVISSVETIAFDQNYTGYHALLQNMLADRFVNQLMKLYLNGSASAEARSEAFFALNTIAKNKLDENNPVEFTLKVRIEEFLEDPGEVKLVPTLSPPDGSPIGTMPLHFCNFSW